MSASDRAGAPDVLYDLIVIGSGFGGALAAAPAVLAGRRVLMIESGDWVARGDANWTRDGFFDHSPQYDRQPAFDVTAEGTRTRAGRFQVVGGASVFYGGVALRMREADFEADPEIEAGTNARWPYRYADLEPFYTRAEVMLGVAGAAGDDPTDPPRSADFPARPAPLAPISQRIAAAARGLGLHPFQLPLAINYARTETRVVCALCGTCDGYACRVSAKNDLSVVVIPQLVARGLELATNTLAVRLTHREGRITGVVCRRRAEAAPVTFQGAVVVVAAGALSTPVLLLASGLDTVSPAGHAIGRYLMRHCNAMVLGVFRAPPAPAAEFHKQIGINDFYFGHPSVTTPSGRLGCLQQFATPAPWTLDGRSPFAFLAGPQLKRTTGFIAIAEDQPQAANRVGVAGPPPGPFDLPIGLVQHRYSARDRAARAALVTVARRILKRAGAWFSYAHMVETFSHALGTVRMGADPSSSPLDQWGAFRGVSNLFVTDASAFPRSAGVNPSLTIAANALRSGTHIAERLARGGPS
jgi:choline dehydrogenase-like flavoprotein